MYDQRIYFNFTWNNCAVIYCVSKCVGEKIKIEQRHGQIS